MQGKIVLIPLKEPKEGMKVVYGKQIANIRSIIDKYHCIFDPDIASLGYLSELQQIAVEYHECCANDGDTECMGAHAICLPTDKSLPLHPDDYDTALPLIGKEVEFETVHGLKYPCSPVSENCVKIAKLITPTPVMYTEEEVHIYLSRIIKDSVPRYGFNVDIWWNENKKK